VNWLLSLLVVAVIVLCVLAVAFSAPPELPGAPDAVMLGNCADGNMFVLERYGEWVRFVTDDGTPAFVANTSTGQVYAYKDDKMYSDAEVRQRYPGGPCTYYKELAS